MDRIRIGLIAGLVAVVVSSVTNIICRWLGILPDAMDLKYMAEWLVDPSRDPTTAFRIGVVLHLVMGSLAGVIYVVLIRRRTPLSGVLFMLASWALMMLVLFPVTGRGLFGLDVGVVMPVATLLLHILYGAVLGGVAGRLSETPQRQ